MNKQHSIGDRLKEWISSKKLSASDFAKQIHIQRSALSHIFSGRNKPSVDVLLKIKDTYPDLNLEWLITGDIIVQNRSEKFKNDESNANLDKSNVTDVNLLNKDPDTLDINISNQAEIDPGSKDRILVRIIELYSDGTFRHFDS